mmetsp:Transcript_28685/g.63138  ORF Transcript_28685/g.63138 Transcript_28685/m.63138 type:complete len:365 (-) Transcript_28685:150-1244(-)
MTLLPLTRILTRPCFWNHMHSVRNELQPSTSLKWNLLSRCLMMSLMMLMLTGRRRRCRSSSVMTASLNRACTPAGTCMRSSSSSVTMRRRSLLRLRDRRLAGLRLRLPRRLRGLGEARERRAGLRERLAGLRERRLMGDRLRGDLLGLRLLGERLRLRGEGLRLRGEPLRRRAGEVRLGWDLDLDLDLERERDGDLLRGGEEALLLRGERERDFEGERERGERALPLGGDLLLLLLLFLAGERDRVVLLFLAGEVDRDVEGDAGLAALRWGEEELDEERRRLPLPFSALLAGERTLDGDAPGEGLRLAALPLLSSPPESELLLDPITVSDKVTAADVGSSRVCLRVFVAITYSSTTRVCESQPK